ncbi:MAG: anaerobic ribonucleoside-triphosphate reductase [Candidatus Accumulibacter sp.]|jgi:hypothetical protein|nr:anaerobic ribonucleoside-triphosphate reductase [Accumulibacter sp.]
MHAICPSSFNPYRLVDHERQRCEVWTRVMGYHRPVSEFNPGKQSEHKERQHFDEPWSACYDDLPLRREGASKARLSAWNP